MKARMKKQVSLCLYIVKQERELELLQATLSHSQPWFSTVCLCAKIHVY